jgi:hypothetical protein
MASLRHRDSAFSYFPEYGLTNVPLIAVFRVALWMTGVLGLVAGGVFGAAAQPIIPRLFSSANVLPAAPMNWRFVSPSNVELRSKYAPPPYRIVTLRNMLSYTMNPSRSIVWPAIMLPPSSFATVTGGTIGTHRLTRGEAVWAKAKSDCRKVEIWFPNKDMQTAPTMNDPTASVTVRITPPSSGGAGNSTVWKKHYRVRPKSGKTRSLQQET